MTLVESVIALQRALNRAQIPSIVIGGIAVAVWGEPRLTRDADLKVLLERAEVDRLLKVTSSGYSAVGSDSRRSLLDLGFAFFTDRKGTRLDLLLADTSFDRVAVGRGVPVNLLPRRKARVCTAEDLIIYKLISTRPRDHEDARGVVRRQAKALDDAYVEDWLRQFEIALDDSTLLRTYREMRAGA